MKRFTLKGVGRPESFLGADMTFETDAEGRKIFASGIVKYYHINGDENPADVLTKFLPHAKWWPLMKPLLHWLDVDKDGTPTDKDED